MEYRYKGSDICDSSHSVVPSPECNAKKRSPIGWLVLSVFLAALCVLFFFLFISAQSELSGVASQLSDSYSKGYSDGRTSAYSDGKADGYEEGYAAAKADFLTPIYPYNGEMFTIPFYEQTCPFTVSNTSDSYESYASYVASGCNYYIRLEYISSDEISLKEGFPYYSSIHNGASYNRTQKKDVSIILPGVGDDVSFFVSKGCTADVDVPPGIYRLWYCCGSDWYGEKYYFGDDTQWYSSDEPLLFYATSTNYIGNTITLYKTSNGNFSTYEVDSEDVPFLK